MHQGEGTEKNVTKAVDLYEEAAALGSVKALNGLGYIYFYGQALPKNEVR
jgi:TPR repeat protein